MSARPPGIVRLLLRAPVCLYRLRCNWLLRHRFMLLIHVGRRTGQRRETVLEVMDYREPGPELVVMSAFGRNADWLRNIEAVPDPEVVVGRRRFAAAYRFLDAAEAISVVSGYEQRNWLVAPIVRLVLSCLLGWSYQSSERDRIRLVSELPLIAFRPRS